MKTTKSDSVYCQHSNIKILRGTWSLNIVNIPSSAVLDTGYGGCACGQDHRHVRARINSRQLRACQGLGTRTVTCRERPLTGRNETSKREKESFHNDWVLCPWREAAHITAGPSTQHSANYSTQTTTESRGHLVNHCHVVRKPEQKVLLMSENRT